MSIIKRAPLLAGRERRGETAAKGPRPSLRFLISLLEGLEVFLYLFFVS